MLDSKAIDRIVLKIARKYLKPANVVRTMNEPATASNGDDALKITIVVTPEAVDRLSGEALLDTVTDIHQRLWAEGEERLPILDYATEAELADAGS